MNNIMTQIILAGRNDEVESWMNILFVVILAVFWALSGIIKARAKNIKGEEEPSLDKPSRSYQQPLNVSRKEKLTHQPKQNVSVTSGLSRQYRLQVEQLRRRVNRPWPIVIKMAENKNVSTIFSEESPQSIGLNDVELERQQPILEQSESKKDKLTTESGKGQPLIQSVGSLLDYTSSEDLKKAVLNYEILGKPLSLRKPDEQIIGF